MDRERIKSKWKIKLYPQHNLNLKVDRFLSNFLFSINGYALVVPVLHRLNAESARGWMGNERKSESSWKPFMFEVMTEAKRELGSEILEWKRCCWAHVHLITREYSSNHVKVNACCNWWHAFMHFVTPLHALLEVALQLNWVGNLLFCDWSFCYLSWVMMI